MSLSCVFYYHRDNFARWPPTARHSKADVVTCGNSGMSEDVGQVFPSLYR